MQHVLFPHFLLCSFIILPIAAIIATIPVQTPVTIPVISSAVNEANKFHIIIIQIIFKKLS